MKGFPKSHGTAVGNAGQSSRINEEEGYLLPTWAQKVTGSSLLLDHCNGEAGKEDQSSLTFDLQG